jgi:hypothetical protein
MLLFLNQKKYEITKGASMNEYFFEGKTSTQDKVGVYDFKIIKLFPIFGIVLISALIAIPLIESNVLKYLDPGSGSFLIQTLMSLTTCSICGIPLVIIGAVVYFLTKNRKKNTQSDSINEFNS